LAVKVAVPQSDGVFNRSQAVPAPNIIEGTTMDHYAGIDVSLESSSLRRQYAFLSHEIAEAPADWRCLMHRWAGAALESLPDIARRGLERIPRSLIGRAGTVAT
jgi:hypothetical protein